MDKASTILGLSLVVLTALPFIIYNVYKKIRKRKFLKDFNDMAEKAKLTFSQKELLHNCYAIGIDSVSKKLFYLNKQVDREVGTLIDLSEVEKCRVVTTDRHIKSQYSNNDHTNRIELVLTYTNTTKPENVLELYKNTEFMPTTDDFAQIENWLNMINSNLKNSQK
jgi:hypothetical protein